mmetsp:Transcript_8888/g.12668  ORF Transcript_8888/g.12668 Transcript_8888/m.12668 type:complete len:175 (+) Transcript_8888:85-609(+)|eukprot:CAMPEP_0184858618 /NCGR_PEP_ID=MMETSP0580-20130426/3699_1 /TAXON_ID=1118495 /ORGANISM="Dactyliosolen fragilissimus" /LENGTH=174 /DNA_ID=CAMNT_0027354859 /DNA_START=53 /DNA_END=577 /DNA_ORIENTATION=+
MKQNALSFLTLFTLFAWSNAYAPHTKGSVKSPIRQSNKFDLSKAAVATFTAGVISSSVLSPMAEAVDLTNNIVGSSSTIVAEKVVREGLYKDYEIDVTPQIVDNAESTYKSAKETKSKKGKYTALLAVLVVGSFIIPMAQYFWYVRDDDSSDNFFAEKVPEPVEPPKKKGWFGK